MGFGLFSAVAVAAADVLTRRGKPPSAAQDKGTNGPGDGASATGADAQPPLLCPRVLIVDWDIHHGNGTQEIFADDKRVLYMSAHAMYAFPAFARDGQLSFQQPTYVGGEHARGYSVNCAWSEAGYGDLEYEYLFDKLFMPVARAFDPTLVIVSAGFDSGAGDEMGYSVTPWGYARLVEKLEALAGGKVVVVLEGGYNIPTVARGIHACVAGLLGVVDHEEAARQLKAAANGAGDAGGASDGGAQKAGPPPEPRPQAVADVDAAIAAQCEFWPCLPRN